MPLMETPYFGFVEKKQFRFWQSHTAATPRRTWPARSPTSPRCREPSGTRVLAKVDALYADYGRGHDGMQLPWVTRCYRAVVRHQELPPEDRRRPRRHDLAPPEEPDERADRTDVRRRTTPPAGGPRHAADRLQVEPAMAFEGLRSRWYARQLGSDADLATFRTLHTASLASPALRQGLNAESVERSLRHLRNLLGTAAVAIADTHQPPGVRRPLHPPRRRRPAPSPRRAVEATSTVVAGPADLACDTEGCLVQHAIASPLVIDDRVAGALVALTDQPSASLLRATEEVASWVSGQLELAELDESRHRLVRAEVRALRAQISPHFIYNSLGAIASFVRTDPDRARELLLEFADFTRYSFRQHGEFTTLAEELRSVERYLLLEQARFGDRLRVTLQVAPEVLGVSIPFLCLQPLVENAVQHGLESAAGRRAHHHRGARRRPRVRHLHRGQRRRAGPRAHPRGPRRRGRRRLGRTRQRRRAAAHDLRRRIRSGRGDRTRRRHQGRRTRAEVRPGRDP